MRVGSFEVIEPAPEIRAPHVIACLTPWVDAGSVGSLALSRLERYLGANDLASIATPGRYFDFTRYRPVMYYQDGQRKMTIPNTNLRYARGGGEHDFIFLHMLEPHAMAEEYIDNLAGVLRHFGVRRFCRIGGMYDAVPHTRPLLVFGTLNGAPLDSMQGVEAVRRRPYQGPTSIMGLMNDRLSEAGVENMMLMVRLPHYVELEEDYAGRSRLLQVLCNVYGFPNEVGESRRAERQYQRIGEEMERNPQVKMIVERLETDYDARRSRRATTQREGEEPADEASPPLPPSVERFLGELDMGREDDEA